MTSDSETQDLLPGEKKKENVGSINSGDGENPVVSKTTRGLSPLSAALFIIGEIAGSGVLALPNAMENAGWVGFVILILCCAASCYCGIILARCWTMLQERYPQYRSHVRHPYQVIGYEAAGKLGRYAVSFCMDLSLFGATVVVLILASQNVMSLFRALNIDISFCYWCIVLAAVLAPVSWLGSPKDFWPVALVAMLTTLLASICLVIQMVLDKPSHTVTHRQVDFQSFFLAFGTLLFAFGGLPLFPTIQNDMEEPKRFTVSVIGAMSSIVALYLPVSLTGFLVYGAAARSNIIQSVSNGGLRYTVEILITIHLLMAFVIILNPVCQGFEELFKTPLRFNWRRCLIRTGIVAMVLFVAESIPHFGNLLALVGGSTNTLLTFAFPSVFYIRLCGMEGDWPKRSISVVEKVFNVGVVCVGIFGGVAATYSAIAGIVSPGTFVPPCYINITAATGN